MVWLARLSVWKWRKYLRAWVLSFWRIVSSFGTSVLPENVQRCPFLLENECVGGQKLHGTGRL
eukprot:3179640-Amphidinium_carterae.1